MSKRQVLMILGAWVMILFVLPGFPDSFKKILALLSGLIIIFVAYRLKPEPRAKVNSSSLPYGESRRENGQQQP